MATKGKKKDSQNESQSLWSRSFKRSPDWTKEDLTEVVHWLRQIVAVICGVIWGIIPLKGFVGIASYCAISVVVVLLYTLKYLGIEDEEDLGTSRWDLMQEGFMPALAFFLITWITSYNFVYYS